MVVRSPHIRWMIRRDMPEVLAIENDSFEFPWTYEGDDSFVWHLRQRNCIGMVAEIDNEVGGYMVYGLGTTKIDLLNFAVRRDLRRERQDVKRQQQRWRRRLAEMSTLKRQALLSVVNELRSPGPIGTAAEALSTRCTRGDSPTAVVPMPAAGRSTNVGIAEEVLLQASSAEMPSSADLGTAAEERSRRRDRSSAEKPSLEPAASADSRLVPGRPKSPLNSGRQTR